MDMKRTYLYFIAVFFLCAIALLFVGVSAHTQHSALPAFSQKQEWKMPGKRSIFPYFAP
jgi:hypothetical protein